MGALNSRRSILMAVALVAIASVTPLGRSSDLAVQGRTNANASLAASGAFVVATWGASTKDRTDVYAAVSRDGGRTFRAPIRVNDEQTQANLSGEQPPRVTLASRAGREPSVVVVWTAKQPAGTRLLSAQSVDGGKSFAPPTVVSGSDAAGNRGWEATAVDRDGRVVAIWLDHRELAPPPGAAPHVHKPGAVSAPRTDGVARAQRSKLFFATLGASDSVQQLTGGVCYCCKTTLATGADGAIYAAWRHVYPGNVRDIAFTMSRNGGRTFTPPARVSEDGWVLDACPENGPSIAVDDKGGIHLVWPTLVSGAGPDSEPTLAIFYAGSTDGRHFTPRQRIPTEGFPRHPQIALGPRGPVVTWDEQAGGVRRVAIARGVRENASGAFRFTRQPISDAGAATYPAIAATSSGVVVAWTSGIHGQTVLRTENFPN